MKVLAEPFPDGYTFGQRFVRYLFTTASLHNITVEMLYKSMMISGLRGSSYHDLLLYLLLLP
jgi:hypothetical protein